MTKDEARIAWLDSILVKGDVGVVDLRAIEASIDSMLLCIEQLKKADSPVYRVAMKGAAKELFTESRMLFARIRGMNREINAIKG